MAESTVKPSKPTRIKRPVTAVNAMRFGAKKFVEAIPSNTSNATSHARNVIVKHTRIRWFFNFHIRTGATAHAAPTRNCQARVIGLKNANDSAICVRSKTDVPNCPNNCETGNEFMTHQEITRLHTANATIPINTLRLQARAFERRDRKTMSATINGKTK